MPQSGSELERFFDLSLDLLVIAGLDGYLKRANAAYERTMGYPMDELLARPMLDVVHPDDVASVAEVLGGLAQGEDVIGFENRVVCGDGSVRWLQWNTRAMPERGIVFGVGRDVTDRHRADADLREAQLTIEASRDELRALADEQAALRRVATLVAEHPESAELFSAVAREVAAVVDVSGVMVERFEADGSQVVLGSAYDLELAGADAFLGVGVRLPLEPGTLAAAVFATHRAARVEDYSAVEGTVGDAARAAGVGSGCAAPIIVDGRLWGEMCVFSSQGTVLPAGTEHQLDDFVKLVVTAISNYDARGNLRTVADEQAALRRVATLVARGTPSDALFAAVCEEVEALAGADASAVVRFESDARVTVMGDHAALHRVGARVELDPDYIVAEVRRTGEAARFDTDDPAVPGMPEIVQAERIYSALASPIVVEGELWGAITTFSRERPLAAGMERRLADFTELVATAISNLQARAELAASRARIAAAADDERRRVVRDLHDGAQQRLVHTVITLKLAQRALAAGEEDGPPLVREALGNAEQAMAELRDLAHGILPSALIRGGLRAGIDALGSRTPVPVEVDVSVERLPAPVEATAYFVVAEALTNMAKHASARHADVVARTVDGALRVEVRDDGVGGASPDGSGLVGLADRLVVLDGRLEVDSPPGGGTRLTAVIPL